MRFPMLWCMCQLHLFLLHRLRVWMGENSRTYTHELYETLTACYQVSAIDIDNNESPVSNEVCVSDCPIYELPNAFTPNGDGINDTWVIPQSYVSGTNTSVTILSSQGKVMLQTEDYLNNWPENQLDFSSAR